MKKWKDQEAEKALFGDPLRATKAIMKTCDVIDRNGLVSETELRVGLENSPYTSFLRHMVGSKANRFRFYARDKCGKLSFSALLTAVKDFNETKNPEKMPINHHVDTPHARVVPFRPTGTPEVRRQDSSWDEFKRRHEASGCRCKNPACQKGQKAVKADSLFSAENPTSI